MTSQLGPPVCPPQPVISARFSSLVTCSADLGMTDVNNFSKIFQKKFQTVRFWTLPPGNLAQIGGSRFTGYQIEAGLFKVFPTFHWKKVTISFLPKVISSLKSLTLDAQSL